MQDAIHQLEIEFKRICNDLEFVSHTLDTEFDRNGQYNIM
jgi:hypothetical protein